MGYRRVPQEKIDEVIRFRKENGYSENKICQLTKLSGTSVHNILLKNNLIDDDITKSFRHIRTLTRMDHIPMDWFLQFDDPEKFSYLRQLSMRKTRHEKICLANDTEFMAFMERFYYDPVFCEAYACKENKQESPSIDHKIPLIRGGKHEVDNLQVLPLFLNRAKGENTPEEFESQKQKYWTKYL